MGERELLIDELQRAFDGVPWHGSPTRAILADVTAREASARPIASAHTIWEILLHLTTWTNEVVRRMREGRGGDPVDGDWPVAPAPNDAAWRRVLADHAQAHETLLRALASFPESRLTERYGVLRDRAEGTGEPFAVMLHGLSQHAAYHTAQIALLKKALRAP